MMIKFLFLLLCFFPFFSQQQKIHSKVETCQESVQGKKINFKKDKIMEQLSKTKIFKGHHEAFIIPNVLDTSTNEIHYYVAVSTWKQSEHPDRDNAFDDEEGNSGAASNKYGAPCVFVSEAGNVYDVTFNPETSNVKVSKSESINKSFTGNMYRAPYGDDYWGHFKDIDKKENDGVINQLVNLMADFCNKDQGWYFKHINKY